ncbi:deleted in malignant brain tumors 1 protein-like [Haliotis rufescens]|uniref:deleted in malignant brain tumors 1 protein-like n=1 Tax=Haliotis rufescens TaxID=6454 RepID=UPI00201F231C|nr:deleted in malignant brain tumors 1 protein-like [Haliotis rufescens]
MASYTLTCVLMMISVQLYRTDAACPPPNMNATPTQMSFMSSNYPDRYGRNENCTSIITAQSGQVVHVMSVDMDLHDDGNCTDKIRFFDGTSTTAAPLKMACGKAMVMVQSMTQVMTIRFVSDGMREDKGFYLKIWSAPSYPTSCQASPINVGVNPVFLPMPPLNDNNAISCTYTLMAPAGSMVMLGLPGWMESEALACGTGSIKVYDRSVMMIDSCGGEQPFWNLDSSGENLTVQIATIYTGAKPKQFMLKATSMSLTVTDCDNVKNFPIGPVSSYIWYPNFMTAPGQYCDKTLLAPGTTARATVMMSTSGVEVMCNANPFPVEAIDGASGTKAINKACMEGGKPMFMSTGPDLTLKTPTGSTNRVLLKVASFKKHCNGMSMNMMTDNGTVKTAEHEDIQRDSQCVYKVMSPMADEVVNVHIESTLMDINDCVTVYDGADTTSTGEKMCGSFKKMFSGTGPTLTYKIMTNHKMMDGKVMVKYFSVRKEGGCPEMMNILAKREKVIMKSPNFPMQYPLFSKCSWRFVSYRPDYVVVIEVLESNLPEDCSDYAFVNDGDGPDSAKLGEWCGNRKPVYRGTGQVLMLTFTADDMNMHKSMMNMGNIGFEFRYYADTLVPREMAAGTDVLTIAGVLSLIVLVGGILFITYRLCNERRIAKKQLKEDREPITH